MYRKERREALDILRRFVRGEIEEEPLLGFVERLDLRSIHHLFQTLELGTEDFLRIGIRGEDLARPVREFLAGGHSLDCLRRRIRRMGQIVSAAECQADAGGPSDLGEALNLLGLVLDPSAPVASGRIPGYLAPILSALDGDGRMPFQSVMAQVLREVEVFHFTTLRLLEFSFSGNGRPLPWSDMALLYGRPVDSDPRGDKVPEANLAPVWFIPLSVTTRRFYEEGLPARLGSEEGDASWMDPGKCRMAALRQICPSIQVESRRSQFFVDPRGFTEIVLDVEELSIRELSFAVQLFALHHGARGATLEGEPVKLLAPAGGACGRGCP